MTKTKIGDSEWLLVEVPEDAKDFGVHNLEDCSKVVFSSIIQDPLKCGGDMIRIPLGNYTIIGRPTQLSESDWEGIVEPIYQYDYPPLVRKEKLGYKDYEEPAWRTTTATESGLSWIRSLNLDPERVVILKIEK